MYSLARLRLFRTPFSSLRSARLPSTYNTAGIHCQSKCLPRRAFASQPNSGSAHDFFDYTSGRWIVNDELRLAERRREFDVHELCRLAAQSVGRRTQDINEFVKLAEGGFNRVFLITMHDGFQMVARIPYPITVPKFLAVASEVATMRFLRASGLPVPEVYDYCPSTDNAARTEYIFMEHVRGTDLSDVWNEMEESELASVIRQIVELEARMMSIPFPAGGSLYYAEDLRRVGGKAVGIPLNDTGFCVGPDVRHYMWHGRRSQLDVDRGPYKSPEAALVAAARKEQAYLERFGRPLLPFRRVRRPAYEYKEQSPVDHTENLERYLLIAPTLVPKKSSLCDFSLRHPDLKPSNIIISTSSESSTHPQIISLIDWQHTHILPRFLNAGIPNSLQNYNDPVSHHLIPPTLPQNFDELEQVEQGNAVELYVRRVIHYYYAKTTEELNRPHHDASDPLCTLMRRLFDAAGAPWEAESTTLKVALIEAAETWDKLAGEGAMPCPLTFDPEDVRKTKELSKRLNTVADEGFEELQRLIGFGPDTWVSNENYRMAKDFTKSIKLECLRRMPKGEDWDREEADWCLDDMPDEGNYL